LQDDNVFTADQLQSGMQLPASSKPAVNAHFGSQPFGVLSSRQHVQLQLMMEGCMKGAPPTVACAA
jgi:hypothetical protein